VFVVSKGCGKWTNKGDGVALPVACFDVFGYQYNGITPESVKWSISN